jgi:hypothetical protein
MDDDEPTPLSAAARERMASCADAEYWLRLCPQLHVGNTLPPVQASELFDAASHRAAASEKLLRDGYFDLDALPPTSSSSVGAFAPLLAEAVVTLGEHGWRPCFVIVFDEAFRLVEELSMALAAVVGGDPIVPIWDFFAWHVKGGGGSNGAASGKKDAATTTMTTATTTTTTTTTTTAGWPPHRDRDVPPAAAPLGEEGRADEDGRSGGGGGHFDGFDGEGRTRFLTVWFALTEATPRNGCLYVLPRWADRGYSAVGGSAASSAPLPSLAQLQVGVCVVE